MRLGVGSRWHLAGSSRLAVAGLCLCLVPWGLHATPGALDSGFGVGGTAAVALGGAADAVACFADGTMMVGGSFGVARVLQDGSLDTSFGQGGVVSLGLATNQTLSVNALLLQPDGKIVASVGNGLVRLLASGALDSGFGQAGFSVEPGATNLTDAITALRLLPDGRILASGVTSAAGGIAFLVLRFTAQGVSDATFGNGGRAWATFSGGLAVCRTLTLPGDGSIVLGGGVLLTDVQAFGLARFTAAGVLDATFGNGGEVVLPMAGANFAQINGLALQSTGRIIAAGVATGTNSSDFVVVRLNQDGSLDEAFGDQGIVRTDFSQGSRDIGGAVEVTPDDKILVAGSSGPSVFKAKFAIARYNPDGSLDGSFGQSGLVTTQFPTSDSDEATELAPLADGRLILAGRTAVNGADACGLARYHVSDLGVVESVSTNLVAVGDTYYYNAVVENDRTNGVTGVHLLDRLPSSVHFASAFTTQGTCTNFGDVVFCDLGALPSGGQATVTLFVTMHATAHLCNGLTVFANETDPGLTNSAVACATIDPLREQSQNLAVTAIRAPRRVVLTDLQPTVTRLVAVQLQNRSPGVEQLSTLTGLVDLAVLSLTNSCPDLVPVLVTGPPQPRLPVSLAPKATVTVYFNVQYSRDCVPDPLKTTPAAPHNDYEYQALAHQAVVNDNRDTFPTDDICPRPPVGNVTTTGRVIKDRGCGGRVLLVGFGAPVLTDVIVK